MSIRQMWNNMLAGSKPAPSDRSTGNTECSAPQVRRSKRGHLQSPGRSLGRLMIACLLCMTVSDVVAQSMIPNPKFDLDISPWTTSGDVSYDSRHFVRLGPEGRITTEGQFFGQGYNVILFSAAGLRTAETRTARISVAGGYAFKGTSFSNRFNIPTGNLAPTQNLAINGPFKSFVWVPMVAPTGNGTGSFSIYTDDEEGVLVDNVYGFFLRAKSGVGVGKAAGLASLSGSLQNTGSDPVVDLNGTSGKVTVTGVLAVAGYVGPTGPGSITVEAGGTAAELNLLLYDFKEGEWVHPSVKPGSSAFAAGQISSQGWRIGKNFEKITLTGFYKPERFIEPASRIVVMQLIPSRGLTSRCIERIGGPKCPPPPSVELRNFNILP